jgi:SAM-dependent methyltransferase
VPAVWTDDHGPSVAGPWGDHHEHFYEPRSIFRPEACEFVRSLRQVVPVDADTRVLDYGCGFGFVAEELAPHVRTVALWDGSHSIRRQTRARIAHVQNIRLIDLQGSVPEFMGGSFDVILIHSVIQYMTRSELAERLVTLRGLLAAGGRIIISDIVTRGHGTLREIAEVMRFAARHGILVSTLIDSLKMSANYVGALRSHPLSAFDIDELRQLAHATRLSVSVLPHNLGHKQSRLSISLEHCYGVDARTTL